MKYLLYPIKFLVWFPLLSLSGVAFLLFAPLLILSYFDKLLNEKMERNNLPNPFWFATFNIEAKANIR